VFKGSWSYADGPDVKYWGHVPVGFREIHSSGFGACSDACGEHITDFDFLMRHLQTILFSFQLRYINFIAEWSNQRMVSRNIWNYLYSPVIFRTETDPLHFNYETWRNPGRTHRSCAERRRKRSTKGSIKYQLRQCLNCNAPPSEPVFDLTDPETHDSDWSLFLGSGPLKPSIFTDTRAS
jgi:hypothetical protein